MNSLNAEFLPANINTVMGANVVPTPDGKYTHEGDARTPLHVEFSSEPGFSLGERIEDISDRELFNAIGSRVLHDHLPVLDIDGGASVELRKMGRRLVMKSVHPGTYTADSNLRDILGDYGFDTEVLTYPDLSYSTISGRTSYTGRRVGEIIVRSNEDDLEVAPSTTDGHSHVYIQKRFTDEDHRLLIDELASVGVLRRNWVQLSITQGMGVVRTPWTQKKPTHIES